MKNRMSRRKGGKRTLRRKQQTRKNKKSYKKGSRTVGGMTSTLIKSNIRKLKGTDFKTYDGDVAEVVDIDDYGDIISNNEFEVPGSRRSDTEYVDQEAKYVMHGKGKIVYKNGDVYDGEWRNGSKDGKGKMVYKNGDIYDGEWFNDLKHGDGKMVYKIGDVYDGEWVDDKRKHNIIHNMKIVANRIKKSVKRFARNMKSKI